MARYFTKKDNNVVNCERNSITFKIERTDPNGTLPSYVINDKSSNYNVYSKDYIPKTTKSHPIPIKEQIPIVKNFNPRYTKRTNIDKKILRKFKAYLKEKYQIEDIQDENSNIGISSFWQRFICGNLFPPTKVEDNLSKTIIEFKSFNTQYITWIFSQEGGEQLYDDFVMSQGNETLSNLSKEYELDEKQKTDLGIYLYGFARGFSSVSRKLSSNVRETKSQSVQMETSPREQDESILEKYLGQNFDIRENSIDLFHDMYTKYESKPRDREKTLERSRELDDYLLDNVIKSDSSSDQEE